MKLLRPSNTRPVPPPSSAPEMELRILVTGCLPASVKIDGPMPLAALIERMGTEEDFPVSNAKLVKRWYINNEPISPGYTAGDVILQPGDIIAGCPPVTGHEGSCLTCPTCKGSGETDLFTSRIPCSQCGNPKYGHKGHGFIFMPQDWMGFGLMPENKSRQFDRYRAHQREKHPHVRCSCGAEYVADRLILDDCLKCRKPLAWDIEPTEELPMARFMPAFEVEYEGEVYPMGPYKIVGGWHCVQPDTGKSYDYLRADVLGLHSTPEAVVPEDWGNQYMVHPHVSSCYRAHAKDGEWIPERPGQISWGPGAVQVAENLKEKRDIRGVMRLADAVLREEANSSQQDTYLKLHHWPTLSTNRK